MEVDGKLYLLDTLPTELIYRISIYLIYPKKPRGGKIWCYCCGELGSRICDGLRCTSCCSIHCFNQSNYFLRPFLAPPMTEEEWLDALLHLPIHVS